MITKVSYDMLRIVNFKKYINRIIKNYTQGGVFFKEEPNSSTRPTFFCTLNYSVIFQPYKRKNVGIDLFFRSVARQVSSAPHSLTSVFGMGTGGPYVIKTPTFFIYSIVPSRLCWH